MSQKNGLNYGSLELKPTKNLEVIKEEKANEIIEETPQDDKKNQYEFGGEQEKELEKDEEMETERNIFVVPVLINERSYSELQTDENLMIANEFNVLSQINKIPFSLSPNNKVKFLTIKKRNFSRYKVPPSTGSSHYRNQNVDSSKFSKN